jgi:hypothetical protein
MRSPSSGTAGSSSALNVNPLFSALLELYFTLASRRRVLGLPVSTKMPSEDADYETGAHGSSEEEEKAKEKTTDRKSE